MSRLLAPAVRAEPLAPEPLPWVHQSEGMRVEGFRVEGFRGFRGLGLRGLGGLGGLGVWG